MSLAMQYKEEPDREARYAAYWAAYDKADKTANRARWLRQESIRLRHEWGNRTTRSILMDGLCDDYAEAMRKSEEYSKKANELEKRAEAEMSAARKILD